MLEDYLKIKSEYIDDKLEAFLPKEIDIPWMRKKLNDTEFDIEIINELTKPIWDLLERGGKRWRPIFMMLCCDAVGGGAKIEDLIPVVEIIHNGTLMVDDVEDNSNFRRGKLCIHHLYGVDVAINTGNMMYFLPYLILKDIDLDRKLKLLIYELIFEEMLKISIGQGMDIYWHNNGKKISEKQYLKMCSLKTGTLARLSAKIGAIVGNASKIQIKKLGEFAENIGVAFQIQDDILNITNKKWGKEYGDDITEGKRSLLVIRAINIANNDDKLRLLEILSLKTKEKKLIEEAIKILEKYDTINYAKLKAISLVENAWDGLNNYLKDSDSKEKLKLFADYLINREI